ncbi:MAG TPA: inositol monophosphatase, partial [Candidatus Methylomirabilis sp.]|nr:inositol monophosphatase [Candidatus Methylomirabilis sp.]
VLAAKRAGLFLVSLQKDARRLEAAHKDFLTDADLESDKLIRELLVCFDSAIPIYSEEDGCSLLEQGRMWVVDPLDGTVNFFHQDQLWGVSLALIEDGRTKIGAVYLPILDEFFGATDQVEKIANTQFGVNSESRLAEAQIWTDWSKWADDTPALLDKLNRVSLYPQIRLCATASLMAVASGRISAYVHPHPAPEDFAAGALIVEKAGGRVTDFSGKPWSVFSESLVASNGLLHDEILRAIA